MNGACVNNVSFGYSHRLKTDFKKGRLPIKFDLAGFELTKKKIKFKNSKIIEIMKQDKKVENNKINLLLPVSPGSVELFDNIDLPSIEACLL